MAAATGWKVGSIHDYPEHLNPFHEDDNHNQIRFWTLGKRLSLSRSNSINFSGIKDLKNSWAFRSFMRKGKKGQSSSSKDKMKNQVNGESSPVVFRRALQYSSTSTAGQRSTVGSPERYVYGGSVTPLPRSRFQERLRSCSQQEVGSISASPRMARSEVSGSRLSVESTNPFEEAPVPPVRASRRKKKRAPPPPQNGAINVSITSETSQLDKSVTDQETKTPDTDLENIEEVNLNVELKIVEDEENAQIKRTETTANAEIPEFNKEEKPSKENEENSSKSPESIENEQTTKRSDFSGDSESNIEYRVKNSNSEDILHSMSFPKIDIAKYRRNSSVNDNDIRLRRGNLGDFHAFTTKRCKSLNNTTGSSYVSYDINLNEDINLDKNCNEEPQKVICKLEETPRKQSLDNSVTSTEKEFLEIDKVRKEFEREINKLNAALANDFSNFDNVSVTDIKRKFDNNNISSPNPIPKPRRSHFGDSPTPVNGNIKT